MYKIYKRLPLFKFQQHFGLMVVFQHLWSMIFGQLKRSLCEGNYMTTHMSIGIYAQDEDYNTYVSMCIGSRGLFEACESKDKTNMSYNDSVAFIDQH